MIYFEIQTHFKCLDFDSECAPLRARELAHACTHAPARPAPACTKAHTNTRSHAHSHSHSHIRAHTRTHTHSPCRLWWNEEWGGAEGWYNYVVGQV